MVLFIINTDKIFVVLQAVYEEKFKEHEEEKNAQPTKCPRTSAIEIS